MRYCSRIWFEFFSSERKKRHTNATNLMNLKNFLFFYFWCDALDKQQIKNNAKISKIIIHKTKNYYKPKTKIIATKNWKWIAIYLAVYLVYCWVTYVLLTRKFGSLFVVAHILLFYMGVFVYVCVCDRTNKNKTIYLSSVYTKVNVTWSDTCVEIYVL